jgi:EAL domain-containing protein (putative c-di-GMP-specific phosphodiesterase class I)
MADTKQIKEQRDRFLAFSFASADFFMEVTEGGNIAYALGAARSLAGMDDKTLNGRPWLEMFSPSDHASLLSMVRNAKPGQRCGPVRVVLDEKYAGGRNAILTAIKMPGDARTYITIGFMNDVIAKVAEETVHRQQKHAAGLLDKDDFIYVARDALDMARNMGQDVDMTLLEIPNARETKAKMGAQVWDSFTASLTELLSGKAFDGQAATQIVEGKYSVIHDKSVSPDSLRNQIETLSKENDPSGGGFSVNARTVSADLRTLSEREATKALVYTISEFERKGSELNIDTLNNSFKAYVTVNAHKIQQFKSMIDTLNFDLHFQPIVNMETLECSHFEMLSRFRGEASTQEWVMFGEDIGMAPSFDMAVCERALNYLQYKSQGRRTRFAVNLSGLSIQNEAFFKNLMAKLASYKGAADRIMFEITESAAIQDLDLVSKYVSHLRSSGYKVCLDDFGAGAAAFQYLQKLPVDYVKIDGQYTRRVAGSERDRLLLKNLANMCKDLGIAVIAEQIEEQEQAEIMRDMGIVLGQGFLFAKPSPKPEYAPPAKMP